MSVRGLAEAFKDHIADLFGLPLVEILSLEVLHALLVLMAQTLDLVDVDVLQAGELRGLVAHHLQLLGTCCNHKGACTLKLTAQFGALFQVNLLSCLFNVALASHSEMLSHLNVLLLSFELIDLLLKALNQVLRDGILRHAALADTHSGVRGAQVELLEYLIL